MLPHVILEIFHQNERKRERKKGRKEERRKERKKKLQQKLEIRRGGFPVLETPHLLGDWRKQ